MSSSVEIASQTEYWNGEAGEKWAIHAEAMDAMLGVFADRVIDASDIHAGDRVLDVGCGSGASSLKAVAAGAAHVTGVDVSAPMLAVARDRTAGQAQRFEFIEADASVWQASAPFDRLISRFGVMFFDDPVAAFSNLRAQMKPGGQMAFSCWQAFKLNTWAFAPFMAVLPLLDEPPPRPEPGAPGPFAFADPERLKSIMSEAGWTDISLESWTGDMELPGATLDEATSFAFKFGPVSRLAETTGKEAEMTGIVRELFSRHQGKDGCVRLPGAAWIVAAGVDQ